jgi:hypothetical protein
VSIAVVVYAAAGLSTATLDRAQVSQVSTGAPRVIDVISTTRSQLLAAVRAADPSGTWAMAVVGRAPGVDNSHPVLAVDATRLAAVATWLPGFGSHSAAQVAALLHPTGYVPPPAFHGTQLTVRGTVAQLSTGVRVHLGVTVVPLDGKRPAVVSALLAPGPLSMTFQVPCTAGCLMPQFVIRRENAVAYRLAMTVTSVNTGPAPVVDFGAMLGWRAQSGTVSATAGGLALTVDPTGDAPDTLSIWPGDRPSIVPAVSTRTLGPDAAIVGLDGDPLRVAGMATVPALPGLGRDATYVDLEFADMATADDGTSSRPQVWLGPRAPADALHLLAAHGILANGTTTQATVRRTLDHQGAMLALRYHRFAAGLALALAIAALILVAGVERRSRGAEFRALKIQGVSGRTIARAARGGYASLVVTAALLGLGSGAAAWVLSRPALPIFAEKTLWPPPPWPSLGAVAVPWAVASALLVLVALVIGADLRRSANEPATGAQADRLAAASADSAADLPAR